MSGQVRTSPDDTFLLISLHRASGLSKFPPNSQQTGLASGGTTNGKMKRVPTLSDLSCRSPTGRTADSGNPDRHVSCPSNATLPFFFSHVSGALESFFSVLMCGSRVRRVHHAMDQVETCETCISYVVGSRQNQARVRLSLHIAIFTLSGNESASLLTSCSPMCLTSTLLPT